MHTLRQGILAASVAAGLFIIGCQTLVYADRRKIPDAGEQECGGAGGAPDSGATDEGGCGAGGRGEPAEAGVQ